MYGTYDFREAPPQNWQNAGFDQNGMADINNFRALMNVGASCWAAAGLTMCVRAQQPVNHCLATILEIRNGNPDNHPNNRGNRYDQLAVEIFGADALQQENNINTVRQALQTVPNNSHGLINENVGGQLQHTLYYEKCAGNPAGWQVFVWNPWRYGGMLVHGANVPNEDIRYLGNGRVTWRNLLVP
ncbi:MAG: hypothetical protein F6K14_01445 [Symploca sp. SIO2C1]|nr:hypothetical protein [Symploca sp. SIO2C1]